MMMVDQRSPDLKTEGCLGTTLCSNVLEKPRSGAKQPRQNHGHVQAHGTLQMVEASEPLSLDLT